MSTSGMALQVQKAPYDRPVRTEFKILARIRIAEPNKPLSEIAKEMGYAYQTILTWTRNMDYQRYENYLLDQEFEDLPPDLQSRRERVREKYGLFTEEMQDRLLSIIETTTDLKLQAQIAEQWLDRAGFAVQKGNTGSVYHVTLTPELLEMFEKRKTEARLLIGNIIDMPKGDKEDAS